MKKLILMFACLAIATAGCTPKTDVPQEARNGPKPTEEPQMQSIDVLKMK